MFLIAKFLVEVELTVHAGMAALVHTNFIIKELDFTLLNDMSCEIKREESIEDAKTHFRDIYIKSIMKIILVFCLLLACLVQGQNICLHRECQDQIDGCNADCVATMGKCVFSCTLSSLGCLQQCLTGNTPALALLGCSYDKCINV